MKNVCLYRVHVNANNHTVVTQTHPNPATYNCATVDPPTHQTAIFYSGKPFKVVWREDYYDHVAESSDGAFGGATELWFATNRTDGKEKITFLVKVDGSTKEDTELVHLDTVCDTGCPEKTQSGLDGRVIIQKPVGVPIWPVDVKLRPEFVGPSTTVLVGLSLIVGMIAGFIVSAALIWFRKGY